MPVLISFAYSFGHAQHQAYAVRCFAFVLLAQACAVRGSAFGAPHQACAVRFAHAHAHIKK